jgi:hypothetical protein
VMHGGTIVREFAGPAATAHDVMAAALGQRESTDRTGAPK